VLVLSPEQAQDDDTGSSAAETAVLDYLAGIDVGSALLVPVGVGAECLGCLALTRPQAGRRWTSVEVEAARDIGMDLGRAVLNARSYEREQQAVLELQALNAYKTQLVATLSHELKTPLASILGNLELLEGEDLSPEDGRRGLSALGRGAARLVRVVDDLMLLARVGDPSHQLVTRPVDLEDVVTDVLDLMAPTATQRGVTLDLVCDPEPVLTRGDSAELDRVITNIVSNALKYTPPGGHVTLGVHRQGEDAVVSCADTGIGISEDDRAQLFREFFRSTDPAAQAQSGTGLGLTIVERIVSRHAGRVEVESVVGAGSTFRILLPALDPPGRAATLSEPGHRTGTRG
jgi:signal transduction histidine kinase